MAEPVTTTIVAALVAGAAAGTTAVTTQAVIDGYAALKSLISRKFSAVDVAALEKKPDSEARQHVLAEELEEAGAARDEELKVKAVALLTAIEELQTKPEASALFDFAKLRAMKNFEISNIRAIGAVLRAHEAIFEGDFKASNIDQTGGASSAKH